MKRFWSKLHLIQWTRDDESPGGASSLEKQAAACKQGDRSAQKRLFEALAPKMMAVCLRYMGNREDAEDVLQEGFVTLFTKIDSYEGAGSFEYPFGIILNPWNRIGCMTHLLCPPPWGRGTIEDGGGGYDFAIGELHSLIHCTPPPPPMAVPRPQRGTDSVRASRIQV